MLLGPGGGVFRGQAPAPVISGNEFTTEFTTEFQVVSTAPAPEVGVPVSGTLLFSTTVENADTVPTWAKQELSVGQAWVKGDVPEGTSLIAGIDGVTIPCQVSNRVFWTDGSLKHAQIRMLIPPSIPVGGTKTLQWYRVTSPWASHDAPLHTAPTAVTGKVSLDWEFTSWTGRNSAGVLTAQRGPKYLRSAAMLGTGNAQWIDTIMAGPVCSEWRATAMSVNGAGTADANFGGMLYARAWGGTAGNPARIEFVFRSMFGWSDGVPADEQGIRCSMDLKVNGTVVRGASLATAGWANRDSYNGGFYASAGPTGKTDWFDVATNTFVTPPVLLYRHNTVYGIKTKFFPPFDTNNPRYSPAPVETYFPQGRGTLSFEQDNVGDHTNLAWTASMPFIRAMISHARDSATQAVVQAQACRTTAWGMAALGSIGFNRQTRKLICHLPTALNPDPAALGASVWNGTKPQQCAGNLNPYIVRQDTPHLPQVTWWTYLTEGDQHWLDLAYAEATLAGLFCGNGEGFFATLNRPGTTALRTGGIYVKGQTRGVGHAARPLLNAIGIGHPSDPHHKMLKAMWTHFVEAREAHIVEQDSWRDSAMPKDGRYFADLKMYPMDASQEPQYKIWMHAFSLHSNSYGYGITEDPEARRLAEWWAHTPTVLAGGYHNDADPLMRPDPQQVGFYYHILCSTGTGGTNTDRRPWARHIQWGIPRNVTYKADNQTLDWGTPLANGFIVTITGIHAGTEPDVVVDMTKIPGGLVRGDIYYVVQVSGNTSKLSRTLGGTSVTFDARGADIVGRAVISKSFGLPGHVMRVGTDTSADENSYLIQVKCALDMYQHYVAPDDARVLLARRKLKALKDGRGGGYDLRGLTTVPL